jgi:hypothetical protein
MTDKSHWMSTSMSPEEEYKSLVSMLWDFLDRGEEPSDSLRQEVMAVRNTLSEKSVKAVLEKLREERKR